METMIFSEINANKNGCCLVCHEETVYKVKVIFGEEVTECDSAKLRLELEQVFRAVLHLSQSDKHIPPIYTQHLMVKPLKIYWTISEKIGFRQNGKDLETSNYFFQFHVSERPPWKPTQNNAMSGKNPISTRESLGASHSSQAIGRSGELRENEGSLRNRTVKHTPRKVNAHADKDKNSTLEEAAGENGRIATESGDKEIHVRRGKERGKDEETMDRRRGSRASTSSSDTDIEDQLKNRRCLRSSVRLKDTSRKEAVLTDEGSNTKKQIGRSAVTELSQSGVVDITCGTDSVPSNQQDNWRKKRKSVANVDDITGFSYKVNKFRAKISGGDNQPRKKNRHVLYRAGGCGHRNVHSPLMELPVVSSSGGTAETVNKSEGNGSPSIQKTRSQLNDSTEKRQDLPSLGNTDKHTCSIAKELSHTIPENDSETGQSSFHLIPRTNHDLSTDSQESATNTHSRTFRDGLRKRTMPQSNGPIAASSLKGPLTRQSVLPKGRRVHKRSSELFEGEKSASPAKNVKIATRTVASSTSNRGQIRSETQSKGHRDQIRSATPLKRYRGRMRSATPLKDSRGRMRSATPQKSDRGRMRSATPSKGHRGKTRSTTPSKGHIGQRMPALISPSRSNRRQLRSKAASRESERLLRMQQPKQHGIQLTNVDRYLVEQEELQEVAKLQEMAATHNQQSCYYTRSQRKRSSLRLWDIVDSLIITPAKKMFKRM